MFVVFFFPVNTTFRCRHQPIGWQIKLRQSRHSDKLPFALLHFAPTEYNQPANRTTTSKMAATWLFPIRWSSGKSLDPQQRYDFTGVFFLFSILRVKKELTRVSLVFCSFFCLFFYWCPFEPFQLRPQHAVKTCWSTYFSNHSIWTSKKIGSLYFLQRWIS